MITEFTPEQNELFRKSSRSARNQSECVEVADLPGVTVVRDTTQRDLGALGFASGAWAQALAAVRV